MYNIIKEMGAVKHMQRVEKGWAEEDGWGARGKPEVRASQRKEPSGGAEGEGCRQAP